MGSSVCSPIPGRRGGGTKGAAGAVGENAARLRARWNRRLCGSTELAEVLFSDNAAAEKNVF